MSTDKKKPTYVGADGQTHEVRNLMAEFLDALLSQLELDTPEAVLSFFQRHEPSRFESMQVGVKFPPLPEYYSENMNLKLVIDRGTIWYDLPWNDEGKPRRQRRKKTATTTRKRIKAESPY